MRAAINSPQSRRRLDTWPAIPLAGVMGNPKMALASITSRLQTVAPSAQPSDLSWETMDVATLSKPMQELFAQLLRAQEAERNARKALSEAIAGVLELPPHLTVRIGAKWGKLSVAIDKAQRASSGKPAMSMADLVAKANRIA